jgi:hypothetical protein
MLNLDWKDSNVVFKDYTFTELEAAQQLSLLKLQKMLFICCNTFSGLAVIKVFVQMSHFLEIKKLISKIKKITKGRKNK